MKLKKVCDLSQRMTLTTERRDNKKRVEEEKIKDVGSRLVILGSTINSRAPRK